MSFQNNRYIRALEESISDVNQKIEEVNTSKKELHVDRINKELIIRKKSLMEIQSMLRMLGYLGNNNLN
ncbi:MAG: hypothetical protein PHN69_03135 [Candidatus Pacebacteria bacterium]|nr:hypothetical protein [Candidatus Paceibacterota bacterium]